VSIDRRLFPVVRGTVGAQPDIGLSMPKPYPEAKCAKPHVFRGKMCRLHGGRPENVQDARSNLAQNFAQKTTIA
jgi:hypothetical protein